MCRDDLHSNPFLGKLKTNRSSLVGGGALSFLNWCFVKCGSHQIDGFLLVPLSKLSEKGSLKTYPASIGNTFLLLLLLCGIQKVQCLARRMDHRSSFFVLKGQNERHLNIDVQRTNLNPPAFPSLESRLRLNARDGRSLGQSSCYLGQKSKHIRASDPLSLLPVSMLCLSWLEFWGKHNCPFGTKRAKHRPTS